MGSHHTLAHSPDPGTAWRDHTPGEQAFDRLNPDFAVPADTTNPLGKRAVQKREAGLALGTRTAVALARENDPNPILSIHGQDYQAADAARAARLDHVRSRQPHRTARQDDLQRHPHVLERTGVER